MYLYIKGREDNIYIKRLLWSSMRYLKYFIWDWYYIFFWKH